MPNLSLRGLDASTLSRLKSTARRRRISVNRLIVDALRQQYGATGQGYDDLDALAGKWSKADAAAFDAATAPFAEIDSGLWAAKPKASSRARRSRRAR